MASGILGSIGPFRLAYAIPALVALLPLGLHDVYLQNVLILTLMYAALSQSWNILGGYCGQISLGHAIYFGLGAYASTLLYTHAGVTPWIGMLAGGAVAAVLVDRPSHLRTIDIRVCRPPV